MRIESVSSDGKHPKELREAADWVARLVGDARVVEQPSPGRRGGEAVGDEHLGPAVGARSNGPEAEVGGHAAALGGGRLGAIPDENLIGGAGR